ncbi:hypothetical protein B4U80_03374 [Leptotrombidium deliense]|uniref:GH18 domain-containing protein n=1 Tax=Leptotrombidium deliense TaxID=299467 RepID=A0A443SQ69_9ACAR|nr:hypothetical protein B4U80_03374 [Leptotrombidium deliense]
MGKPTLGEVFKATNQKVFTLAFVLGSSSGCDPKWGASIALDDPQIISQIREIQSQGGEVIVGTGGAMGPYLENSCTTIDSLADAYIKILDTVKTNHLDVDIESTVDVDKVTKALAKVQQQRKTNVGFTLMVQADDYGITPILGVELLKTAKKNGVKVDIVNPMTMEFPSSNAVWGEAVISAAKATLGQMKTIWPELSNEQLNKMLGVTPMIGRNFNGKIFAQSDAQLLINWAISNKIGLLAFWSVGRDNGGCPGGAVSASCSSIQQSDYEFTKMFQQFSMNSGNSTTNPSTPSTPTTPDSTADSKIPTTQESTSSTSPTTENTQSGEKCKGRSERRFDDWCEANCAMGFCPPDYCACEKKVA